MATPDIQIFPKAELQEDWYTHTTLGPSSTGGLAINLDRNGRLAVSFINSGSVFTAHRNLDTDGNCVRTWTVEDTLFPSSTTPKFLDSILSPSNATFLSTIGEDNNVYTLDCSSRFPQWECCVNRAKNSATPVRLSLFTTRKNALRIAVFTSDAAIYILNPFEKSWFQDQAICYNVTPLYDYKVGSAFTQTGDMDNSQWGYVVCGGVWGSTMETGVALIAADQDLPSVHDIQKGKYSSLAYVAIGGNMPRTRPLIFGIDESNMATYFQANGDEKGTYSTAFPFGADLKFAYLDAIFRTGPDIAGNTVEWIDVYALDTSGNLWHTRNVAYDTGRFTAVKRLSNGDIVVPEWETPSIITSKPIKSFDLATDMNGAGHAYVVTELDMSSTSASLEAYVQDITSTGWTTSPVTTINHAAPEILKRNIYYVELTVRKGGAVAPGLTVKITSPEYCQIDANGVSTSVSSGQFYTTTTNARGLICLTIPASKSLACPALSVWVQGMDGDQMIDVQPTGKIQQRFASITVDDLKNAEDQKDQSLIFSGLSDSQLQDLKTSLNQVASAFGNSSVASSESTLSSESILSSAGDTTSQVSWNLFLHPRASKDVSITRQVSNTHMGIISRATQGKSFRICLRPNLSFEYLSNSTGHLASSASVLDEIISSWGDFWMQVTNGVVEVADMVLTPVENGVQTTITCIIDGATKLWNGVASFVRQAFDAIGELFKSVGVAAVKIFNWLAYLFAWDDIKATAVAFRSIFDDQISKAEDYIDKTARTQLDNFFGQAKTWLNNNMGTALTGSKNLSVEEYDKPDSDPSNDLPSSASWLSNKVDNSSKSAGVDRVFTTTDAFTSTIQKFINNLNNTGISDDLSTALQNVGDFFSTLTSRDAMDKLTFNAFAQVVQDIAVLLLDLGQAVIDTLLDVLVEALKMFKDAINTLIDIPVISGIFKEVVGLDLTLFNLITVPMAITVTILYKAITGEAPFPSSTQAAALLRVNAEDGGRPKYDAALVFSTIFSGIYGFTDVFLDMYDTSTEILDSLREHDKLKDILLCTNVVSSWLVMGVGSLSEPTNTRTRYALYTAIIGTLLSSAVAIISWGNRKIVLPIPAPSGPHMMMDVAGTLIPTCYGLASFFSGLWHIVNIANGSESGNTKDWLVVVAELSSAIPGIAKIVKFAKNPVVSGQTLTVADFGHVIATVSYLFASSA